MPDDVLTGTAQVTPPVVVDAMTAPVTPQTPQATTQQPAPSAGGGKTAEQLAAELSEASELIHQTQERLARMEHDRDLERQMRTNLTAERGREPVPEIDYEKLDNEYMQSPARATAKIVESQFAKLREEQTRERTAQYVTSARSAFESARDSAVKANPTLFKGILEDVSREIIGNVDAGLRSGQPVDVEILRNPKYLEAAAVAYRIMSGEDVSKYYGATRTPMTSPYTETPTAGGPPQAVVSLTEEEKWTAKFLGGTPEQWAAAKAKAK
jgi:hypothetical protein